MSEPLPDHIEMIYAAWGECLSKLGRARWELKQLREQAVESGAARWECDPQTGETRFVWVTEKGEAKE